MNEKSGRDWATEFDQLIRVQLEPADVAPSPLEAAAGVVERAARGVDYLGQARWISADAIAAVLPLPVHPCWAR